MTLFSSTDVISFSLKLNFFKCCYVKIRKIDFTIKSVFMAEKRKVNTQRSDLVGK